MKKIFTDENDGVFLKSRFNLHKCGAIISPYAKKIDLVQTKQSGVGHWPAFQEGGYLTFQSKLPGDVLCESGAARKENMGLNKSWKEGKHYKHPELCREERSSPNKCSWWLFLTLVNTSLYLQGIV